MQILQDVAHCNSAHCQNTNKQAQPLGHRANLSYLTEPGLPCPSWERMPTFQRFCCKSHPARPAPSSPAQAGSLGRGEREALAHCPKVHLAVGRREGLVLSFVLRLHFHPQDKRSFKGICSPPIVVLQQPTIATPSQWTSVELSIQLSPCFCCSDISITETPVVQSSLPLREDSMLYQP